MAMQNNIFGIFPEGSGNIHVKDFANLFMIPVISSIVLGFMKYWMSALT